MEEFLIKLYYLDDLNEEYNNYIDIFLKIDQEEEKINDYCEMTSLHVDKNDKLIYYRFENVLDVIKKGSEKSVGRTFLELIYDSLLSYKHAIIDFMKSLLDIEEKNIFLENRLFYLSVENEHLRESIYYLQNRILLFNPYINDGTLTSDDLLDDTMLFVDMDFFKGLTEIEYPRLYSGLIEFLQGNDFPEEEFFSSSYCISNTLFNYYSNIFYNNLLLHYKNPDRILKIKIKHLLGNSFGSLFFDGRTYYQVSIGSINNSLLDNKYGNRLLSLRLFQAYIKLRLTTDFNYKQIVYEHKGIKRFLRSNFGKFTRVVGKYKWRTNYWKRKWRTWRNNLVRSYMNLRVIRKRNIYYRKQYRKHILKLYFLLKKKKIPVTAIESQKNKIKKMIILYIKKKRYKINKNRIKNRIRNRTKKFKMHSFLNKNHSFFNKKHSFFNKKLYLKKIKKKYLPEIAGAFTTGIVKQLIENNNTLEINNNLPKIKKMVRKNKKKMKRQIRKEMKEELEKIEQEKIKKRKKMYRIRYRIRTKILSNIRVQVEIYRERVGETYEWVESVMSEARGYLIYREKLRDSFLKRFKKKFRKFRRTPSFFKHYINKKSRNPWINFSYKRLNNLKKLTKWYKRSLKYDLYLLQVRYYKHYSHSRNKVRKRTGKFSYGY